MPMQTLFERLDEAATDTDPAGSSDEAAARRLESTGRFRILRQLEHRPVRARMTDADHAGLRLGIVVDVETTGLDKDCAEVIEVGAVAFTYAADGIRDVVGEYSGLEQPTRPLSREISRLTGLTDPELAGRNIDRAALAALVRPADIVVAHNSAFDRGFCEKLDPIFATKTWVCSATDIDWKGLGEPVAKLGNLLASAGRFHGAHRALTDCHAVLEVLAAPAWDGPEGAFAQLLAAAVTEMFEIRAEGAPYSARGMLKNAGYRWDAGGPGRAKSWYKIVPRDRAPDEESFCRREIYRTGGAPVVRRIPSGERFR
ncbi:3'-5' exonuclease [uncultured Aureimonas sp.]|uniref:3'-5' exonuclease n=1 Tax=uncultured Aureimonas sp. TaxID=1604662 RepID=UPI0025F56AE6|nr:3'-5' exonuclease [uncultured Aureimonas sp.]